MIVGVVIGLLGVAVGVSGLIGGAVIAKTHRYIHHLLVSLVYTYSAMHSTLCYRPAEAKATGANPAHGMSGPHGKPAETGGVYDILKYT